MKTLLAGWIILQLLGIGITAADIHNKILDKTYTCKTNVKIDFFTAAMMPLAWFLPEQQEITNYCLLK